MARNNNMGPAVVYALVALSTILLAVTGTVNGANNEPFREEWQRPTSDLFIVDARASQGTVKSGNADRDAIDGRSLKLTLNPNPSRGVAGSPSAKTKSLYKYGTYWARVKTANCSAQPKAGVVTGIFTYFNDGADRNGNGLPDNDEIDFEWLCAKPEVVHLGIWTDYRESVPAKFRQVYRIINIKTGSILKECYREQYGGSSTCQPLSESERQPTKITAISNYDSSARYYDYGMTFEANRIRFMIEANGVTHTLWDYRGPSDRLPGHPMHFMHNVWHTNNWTPEDDGSAVEKPKHPVNVYIDTTSFTLSKTDGCYSFKQFLYLLFSL